MARSKSSIEVEEMSDETAKELINALREFADAVIIASENIEKGLIHFKSR